jgi:hypothetical protein
METQVIEHSPVAVPNPAVVASASPLDLPAEQFRAGLDRRKANRRALMEWIRDALVEGVDYGRIPTRRGPSKPSLWKPGAEKICGMLGVTVHYPTLPDYEQVALHGVQLFHVIIRCEIRDASARVVADGVGARSLKQDAGDLNKALKMAEKSAHIDATLRMAGLSEVFTQDLEDLPGVGAEARVTEIHGGAITPAQHRQLEARIRELKLDRERVKSWVQRATRGTVQHLSDLAAEDFGQLMHRLEEWAERDAIRQEASA